MLLTIKRHDLVSSKTIMLVSKNLQDRTLAIALTVVKQVSVGPTL